MEPIKQLTPALSVSGQLMPEDMGALAAQGFQAVINNRPDREGDGQPDSAAMEAAARAAGLDYHYLPVISGQISDGDVEAFRALLDQVEGPVLAFCRTGTRCTNLWAMAEAHQLDPDSVMATARRAGYDLSTLRPRLEERWLRGAGAATGVGPLGAAHVQRVDVLIVGGGAAGCAVAASLGKRRKDLRIAIVEPSEEHYYQPGWTLVGAGVFTPGRTHRAMARCIPRGIQWIRAAAAGFEPERQQVVLEDGSRLGYRVLVVCPGLSLHWDAIEGLRDTLGKNGVTSNYRYDLAPYTWQLVRQLKGGRALFTQPPMPIKCAGAPQKAMYLSCDHWRRTGVLDNIQVDFCSAGAVLFGVADFVPPLMKYVERYGAHLNFNNTLVAVDGPAHKAWFRELDGDGNSRTVEREFDMLHAVPPQRAPDFVRQSPLANAEGWVDVSPETLRHNTYGNIFSLGDVCSAPNAKTAAAVRKQAPIVAENIVSVLDGHQPRAVYDGYGSCPLTVERGKVVLAEFGYGGKLLPTFPLDPTVPRWLAWSLKAHWMPSIYFDLMLKGHELLVKPRHLDVAPNTPDPRPACDYDGVDKK
ncbi:MAG: TIGR01244 family sulfur transferase [Porticoccaceae bacterium]|jgi:sulfide:quinone oxidoreductase|nr:TIGR01244 family sulfur transferase [Porticoccaceae bacterium]